MTWWRSGRSTPSGSLRRSRARSRPGRTGWSCSPSVRTIRATARSSPARTSGAPERATLGGMLGRDPSLYEARESLAYWEARSRRLPRHALRRRREARDMARRWRGRVVDAERAAYGGGVAGTLLLVASERRLPEPARQASLRLARRLAAAAVVGLVALTALAVAGVWALVAALT